MNGWARCLVCLLVAAVVQTALSQTANPLAAAEAMHACCQSPGDGKTAAAGTGHDAVGSEPPCGDFGALNGQACGCPPGACGAPMMVAPQPGMPGPAGRLFDRCLVRQPRDATLDRAERPPRPFT